MSQTNSFKDDLDSFNNAEPIREDFYRMVEGENGKAYFEELKAAGKLPQKIYDVKKIISRVEASINSRLDKANVGLKKINLLANTSISMQSNAPKLMTKIDIVKNGEQSTQSVNFSLNLSAQKLLNLPAEEIYAVVSALVYTSILKKKEGSLSASEHEYEDEVLFVSDAEQEEQIRNRNKSNEQDAGSKSIIMRYLKKFLKDFFGMFDNPKAIEYNSSIAPDFYDKISQAVANDLVGKNAPDETVASMFNVESVAKETVSESEIAVARTEKLREKANDAAEQGNEELFTSYSKQSLELLSYQTKDSFTNIKFGASNENSGMAAFAQNFIAEILANNGISTDAVKITFRPDQYPGVFNPPNNINIDVSKVENVTDFVMTLAHETKHAVDHVKPRSQESSKNGNQQQRTGGAPFNWSEVNNSGLDPERDKDALNFLKKVNAICYHMDPDEREGRLAEIYALRFMADNASGNHALKNEIDENVEAFNVYQAKTIEMGEDLFNPESKYNIKAIRDKFEDMKSSLPSGAARMLEERISYLEELCENGFDLSREYRSVKQAENVSRKIKGLNELEIEQTGPSM